MKKEDGYTYFDQKENCWIARKQYVMPDGSRKNLKRRGKTEEEADERLSEVIKGIEKDGLKFLDILKSTFDDLADYYENEILVPVKRVNGVKVDGLKDNERPKVFIKRFRKHFGKLKLREITYNHIKKYRDVRLASETHYGDLLSMSTWNRECGVLRRMFKIAVQLSLIDKNPLDCGKSLIVASGSSGFIHDRILTDDEEERLIEACSTTVVTYKRKGRFNGKTTSQQIPVELRRHLRQFVIALLDTGCRKSEMQKMTWNRINFESGIIQIVAENTKTEKPRKVGMTERLYSELWGIWQESEPKPQPDERVFKVTKRVDRAFKSACRAAGVPYGIRQNQITLHSLRHSFATRLINLGLNIETVGKLLGHQNPQTTWHYLSVNEEIAKDAASVLSARDKKTLPPLKIPPLSKP